MMHVFMLPFPPPRFSNAATMVSTNAVIFGASGIATNLFILLPNMPP
jgi:hypothetical protein